MSNQDKNDKENAMSNFAANLLNVEQEDEKAKKDILRKGIEEREKSNKNSILSSKLINSELSKIRKIADLSAFVGTSGKIKSPKFRRDDFITLLAREILLIGTEELKDTGGIISMNKLEQHFKESRKNWELRDKDLGEAVVFLRDNKLIPKYEGEKELMLIYFKPIELSSDIRILLKNVKGIDGKISTIISMLDWSMERFSIVANQLVEMGLAILDDEYIFFPGL